MEQPLLLTMPETKPSYGRGKMKTILIAVMVMLILTSPASAWNGKGHMMVAAVAYNKLTEQTKSRVDALLLLKP